MRNNNDMNVFRHGKSGPCEVLPVTFSSFWAAMCQGWWHNALLSRMRLPSRYCMSPKALRTTKKVYVDIILHKNGGQHIRLDLKFRFNWMGLTYIINVFS